MCSRLYHVCSHLQAAALEAKKKGEIEQAKEYLRNCKGLKSLIEASSGGLPVNMDTVSPANTYTYICICILIFIYIYCCVC